MPGRRANPAVGVEPTLISRTTMPASLSMAAVVKTPSLSWSAARWRPAWSVAAYECPAWVMRPRNRSPPIASTNRLTAATVGAPGAVPTRCWPGSTSQSTSTPLGSDCATPTSSRETARRLTRSRRASSRRSLASPTGGWAINKSSIPAPANVSASVKVAAVRPTAPWAIWRCATSALLCVLACGRSLTWWSAATRAIRARFRSITPSSTTAMGVMKGAAAVSARLAITRS